MNDEINIENLEFIERPREGLPFTNVVIILDEPALTAMYSHLQTNLEQESGGLLLGRLSQFDGVLFIEITDILPADHAAATMFQLTFDSNTWAKLDEQKRKLFPDRDTVGWYHSHLGIGAFFSPLDHAFHSAVFIEPWFVGVVIDPIANEQAVYSWQGSEMVESAYYMRRTTARSPSSHRVYNADGKVSALLALVRSSGHSPALIGLLADWERTLSSRGSDEHYFDGDSVHLLRLIVLLTKANRAVRKQAQQLLDRMEHEWLLDLEIMQVIATRMPSTSPVLLAWADADIVALIDSTTLLQAAVDGISKPRHWRLPYEVVSLVGTPGGKLLLIDTQGTVREMEPVALSSTERSRKIYPKGQIKPVWSDGSRHIQFKTLYVAEDRMLALLQKHIWQLSLDHTSGTWDARPSTYLGQRALVGDFALGSRGNMFVSLANTGKVLKLNSEGHILLSIGGDGERTFSSSCSVTVWRERLVVLDSGNLRIVIFDAESGKYLWQWRFNRLLILLNVQEVFSDGNDLYLSAGGMILQVLHKEAKSRSKNENEFNSSTLSIRRPKANS